MNDIFYFIKDAQLTNFADDNRVATFSNIVDDLITEIQKESKIAIGWYRSSKMLLNPDKFQSDMINRLGKLKDSYKLLIDNHEIDSENIALLDIETEKKLNF